MILLSLFGISLSFFGYTILFALSSIVSFFSLFRAKKIEERDTKIGLISLLIISGLWSGFQLFSFISPTFELKLIFYYLGLILGLSAVGPWLYFCSAYTGRTLHREKKYQFTAIIIFIGITILKVTNPIHNLYFTAELVSQPFSHLAVHSGALHWIIMGLAYALAGIGYFMIFELFRKVRYNTKPLAILMGVTFLPLLFDIIGFLTPFLINVNYEPIGVSIFAVGVLFVFIERFQKVQISAEIEDPVIFLDEQKNIKEYNEKAGEIFPILENSQGKNIKEVLPDISEKIDSKTENEKVLKMDKNNETKYYDVSKNPFTYGKTKIGQLITLRDVTDTENYRRELESKNKRLDEFASVVSHDLRNPLNIAKLNVESKNLDKVKKSLDRMENIIEDVLKLAREGQDIGEKEKISLSSISKEAWESIEKNQSELIIKKDFTFLGDYKRLLQLFENLFRNSIEHGGKNIKITVGKLDNQGGFYIQDDGSGIPVEKRDNIFDSGFTTSSEGTGLGLSIVKEIVNGHDWNISVTESSNGGARFEIYTE